MRELLDDPDAHAAQILAQRVGGRLERPVDAGRVHRIVPAHRVVGQRGIFDRARERADLIEARGEGDQAVARNAAVGRLEADDVAERGRLADRAAGIAAESRSSLRTPATAAALPAEEPPGTRSRS